jgi:hypothetical protein
MRSGGGRARVVNVCPSCWKIFQVVRGVRRFFSPRVVGVLTAGAEMLKTKRAISSVALSRVFDAGEF